MGNTSDSIKRDQDEDIETFETGSSSESNSKKYGLAKFLERRIEKVLRKSESSKAANNNKNKSIEKEEEEETEGEQDDGGIEVVSGGEIKSTNLLVENDASENQPSQADESFEKVKVNVGDDEESKLSIFSDEQLQKSLEERTEIFYREVYADHDKILQPTVMVVRREYLVGDACKSFALLSGEDIRKPLYIFFANEEGLDTGGLTREFYQLLAGQILDPGHALFLPTSSGMYHPNPASSVNEAHLQYFEFIGKLMGKALFDMQFLYLPFTPIVYKLICGQGVGFDDLALVEPLTYSSMKKLLAMEEEVVRSMGLTFTVDMNDFGLNQTVPLCENGEDVAVNNSNKHEFVQLYTQWLLVESVRPQLEKLLKGVYDVIPQSKFHILSGKELELILCGSKKVDLDDWKQHTVYEEGYTTQSENVLWFWEIMSSLSQIQHSKVLQFCTGSSCIPMQGFKAMSPKFTICKMVNGTEEHLPVAHTCLNKMEIPQYKNQDQARRKLMKALELGKGFGKI